LETIGKITGSHGVRGDIVFEHKLKGYVDLKEWDALIIELLPESKIPFFIEKTKWQSDTSFLIKLEEINSPEDAKAILQKDVYLSPNVALAEKAIVQEADNYIGYTLYDKEKKVGIIDNILNPKTNPLFILFENTDKEVLIPANEELIIEVDKKEQKVIMAIPDGLI